MINLKNYIIESLFDIDDNIDNMDESIKDQINQFLNDNFTNASKCKISEKPNRDGKYEISSNGDVVVKNKSITSLTNGLFIWTNVKYSFDCSNCNLLTSLEGAPEEIGRDFNCFGCHSLKSLEGAPKEVGDGFYCTNCKSLTSLEGAPKEVGGDFSCFNCDSLTSLKGAPKEVGGDFYCSRCKGEFIEEDVKKVSNVKGIIYV